MSADELFPDDPFEADELYAGAPPDPAGVDRDDVALDALRGLLHDRAEPFVLPPGGDPALDALALLLTEVTAEPAPASPVVEAPLTGVVLPFSRRAPRALAASAIALGLLSAGGVAAAAPGSTLRPLRDAVSSAIGTALHVVVPRRGRAPVTSASPSPAVSGSRPPGSAPPSPGSSTPPSPGSSGAASPSAPPGASPPGPATRSAAAARETAALLDAAEAALAADRFTPADDLLDRAAGTLAQVLPADGRGDLAARLSRLRLRLVAETSSASPRPQPVNTPTPTPAPAPTPARSFVRPDGAATARPGKDKPHEDSGRGAGRPARDPAGG